MTKRQTFWLLLVAFIAFLSFIMCVVYFTYPGSAHELGTDPDAAWFQSLETNGVNCCNMQDCHRTEDVRATPAGLYQVKIKDEWVTVQPENVLRVRNPTGMFVECHMTQANGFEIPYVRCLIPAVGV